MKLTDLQEAKYARSNILQAYDDAIEADENLHMQLTPNMQLGYFGMYRSVDDEMIAYITLNPSPQLTIEASLHTSCPKCKARRRKPCVTTSGRKATKPHDVRIEKLNADDLIKIRDFQLAVSFVKKFLKRQNLPFTEVTPTVGEWGRFVILIEHPELAVSSRYEFELV